MRYPHDIRMKYCGCGYGCGCQNSCGYPRMRIRMRSSDTPLIYIYLMYCIFYLFEGNWNRYNCERCQQFKVRIANLSFFDLLFKFNSYDLFHLIFWEIFFVYLNQNLNNSSSCPKHHDSEAQDRSKGYFECAYPYKAARSRA